MATLYQQKLTLEAKLRRSEETIQTLAQALAEIKKSRHGKDLSILAISASESLEAEKFLRDRLLSQYSIILGKLGQA
ncbi:hypothetical protein WBJ53_15235 [Spirosoma sp. SC4-14]|uniref:hypothetical protein n=1 Tax=Spirosoma sp. SC4-14 TaxID=3128900 RepID=UPI0030D5E2E1